MTDDELNELEVLARISPPTEAIIAPPLVLRLIAEIRARPAITAEDAAVFAAMEPERFGPCNDAVGRMRAALRAHARKVCPKCGQPMTFSVFRNDWERCPCNGRGPAIGHSGNA